jgi:hypothetical protein
MVHFIGVGTGCRAGAALDTESYPLAAGDGADFFDESIDLRLRYHNTSFRLLLHEYC